MNSPKDTESHPWQHLWRSTLDAATGVTGSGQTMEQQLGQWPQQWMSHSLQATQAWWAWWFQYLNPTQLPWRQPGLQEFKTEMARHQHEGAPRSAPAEAPTVRLKTVRPGRETDVRPKAHARVERHR